MLVLVGGLPTLLADPATRTLPRLDVQVGWERPTPCLALVGLQRDRRDDEDWRERAHDASSARRSSMDVCARAARHSRPTCSA